MKLTPAYQAITAALKRDDRISHSSPGRGIFVFVNEDVGFHDITFTHYLTDATRGQTVPRLNIDKSWSLKRLPLNTAKRWKLKTGVETLFTQLGLEITVLESQLLMLADAVPAILRHIESGHTQGFESLLPFRMHLTTSTNIWSVEARELAHSILSDRQTK